MAQKESLRMGWRWGIFPSKTLFNAPTASFLPSTSVNLGIHHKKLEFEDKFLNFEHYLQTLNSPCSERYVEDRNAEGGFKKLI